MSKNGGKSGVVVVTGAGGFIGGHLVKHFLSQGRTVRTADIKPLDELVPGAPRGREPRRRGQGRLP